ncbi:hypothetical protein SASPL_125576 [Salvia splendens]|uniref:Uncharacterized protein n=1 Tax=Salvia splendens TaxID=180675 RepID=A0A8X8XG41_SALSN|nr:protein PHYTOCHROME KINASE SUBSTRATE 3-like [Salvia splendens]KAG6412883.1 hypothetical protein SASPL_125576 [Salvia splendens]
METQDGSSLRVASFSSYIDKGIESLVHRVSAQDHTNMTIKLSHKAADPTRVDSFSSRSSDHNPNSAFTFSHLTPKHAAGEISVFGADRYFNMKLEYQTKTHPRRCLESSAPTTCHSQTTLLPSNQSSKQKKTASRIFTGFGCKTPCFGNKSVQIDEIKDHHQNHQIKKIQDIEESRKSIEVFGSRKIKDAKGSEVATNMERKLSMLTWDAIPKGGNKNLPTSTIGSTSGVGDVVSEASSDLFEIEEVSGSIYPLMQGADDDDDEPSCMMSPATSLYAPSEASIQWSVVTASAADFSALSEFNNDSVSTKVVNQVQKSRPTGLLGCKSIKAVDVANQNVCVKVKNPN